MSDRQYFITDIETGDRVEVTKEHYEMHQSLKRFVTKNSKNIGKVLLFGTKGDLEDNNNFKDLFFKSNSYNFTTNDKGDETNNT